MQLSRLLDKFDFKILSVNAEFLLFYSIFVVLTCLYVIYELSFALFRSLFIILSNLFLQDSSLILKSFCMFGLLLPILFLVHNLLNWLQFSNNFPLTCQILIPLHFVFLSLYHLDSSGSCDSNVTAKVPHQIGHLTLDLGFSIDHALIYLIFIFF